MKSQLAEVCLFAFHGVLSYYHCDYLYKYTVFSLASYFACRYFLFLSRWVLCQVCVCAGRAGVWTGCWSWYPLLQLEELRISSEAAGACWAPSGPGATPGRLLRAPHAFRLSLWLWNVLGVSFRGFLAAEGHGPQLGPLS